MSTRKRQLSKSELAVCRRLRALWTERKDELGLTQDNAAAALGITQGAVSHYLNALNAVGFEAMFQWAQLLRVHPYEIDPTFRERLPTDLRRAVDHMLVAVPGDPFSADNALSIMVPGEEPEAPVIPRIRNRSEAA